LKSTSSPRAKRLMQVIISGEIDIFFNLNILLQPQPIFNDCIVEMYKFSKGSYVLLKSSRSVRAKRLMPLII
jgi:hypothetical protein